MEYRRIGDSELVASEISLGSWLTYGDGMDRDRSEACVRRALDEGINLFDTANVYGQGMAETVLGEILAPVDRSSYLLATKVFFPMSRSDMGLSPAQVRKQCEDSLRRLRTDHIDLYYCHRYDRATPLADTMAALGELVDEGKVRYVGFSEWSPAQIRSAIDLPDGPRFVASQGQYSLLRRELEDEVMSLCAANGISQVVWSPLAQGILTGKYPPGTTPAEDSRAGRLLARPMGKLFQPPVLEAVQRMVPVAAGAGMSPARLALAWVLRQENVASAIVGATRPEQVTENAGAAGITLSADLVSAVEEALSCAEEVLR
jgi:aryl-alcohol dehydrogenase-like predicted oxidoreductase